MHNGTYISPPQSVYVDFVRRKHCGGNIVLSRQMGAQYRFYAWTFTLPRISIILFPTFSSVLSQSTPAFYQSPASNIIAPALDHYIVFYCKRTKCIIHLPLSLTASAALLSFIMCLYRHYLPALPADHSFPTFSFLLHRLSYS